MSSCNNCQSRSLIRDDTTGNLYCDSCGAEQVYDNFQAQSYDPTGPQGTTIRVGSSGTGSFFNYKEKKIFEANKLIEELTFQLKLTAATTVEIKTLINEITAGEFGQGDWFPVLIGACVYVVMRRDRKSLSIAETAAVVGCEVSELGRMIARVVEYRDLKLPEFDIVVFFEKMLSNLLGELDREKLERVRKQGIFLINCSVKWFLTTGRRPGPLVAAVMVFVAEVNGVVGCRIEDLAKQVHAAVNTCRLRYKEILERLVEVAQVLPWGKDVNVKNIVRNAPFVIHYMEMKSMEEEEGEGREEVENENVGFDLGEAVRECLRKEVEYGEEVDNVESDAQYFEVEDRIGSERLVGDGLDKLKISHECLAMIYTKFANEVDNKYLGEREEIRGRKRRRTFELHRCTEWWNGKSDMSKKLLLKKILEKDVGLNAMPPSFVRGCVANQRRREKIKAAKHRIDKIMNPPNTGSGGSCDTCFSEVVDNGKKRKRRRRRVSDIDWEDFIIETLLLHQVKEEEIEKGHYNALLDLHVFNSGVM